MSKALSAGLGVPSSCGTYSAALEGLTGVNEVLMRRDPSIPPLYTTGARWEIRPGDPSETKWRFAPDVVGEGWGDCQDLSAYRAAELRVSGQDPAAHVRVYPTGKNKYHAVVARGNGFVEDPSVLLGMPPFPGGPVVNDQLPTVQGPSNPAEMDARRRIAQSVCGLHPYAAVCGGFLGDETGRRSKISRVRDVAPEFIQPTFHLVGHRHGTVAGWKGVYRTPMKDGSAIVGMTRTHRHPADCIGDAAGLISDIASGITRIPGALAALSPFGAVTTLALMDPSVQHGIGKIAKTVKDGVKRTPTPEKTNGANSDGWPSDWGEVTGSGDMCQEDKDIIGFGLSSITHALSRPLSAVSQLVTRPVSAVANFAAHPSLGNLARAAISPILAPTQAAMSLFGSRGGPTGPAQSPTGWGSTMNATAMIPGMVPGGPWRANTSGQPAMTYFPPGQSPYPQSATPPGMGFAQPPPDANAYNAPTAADYGLPVPGAGAGIPGEDADLTAAFSDPSSLNALESFQGYFG